MARKKTADPKLAALRLQRSLNTRPEKVADPLFATSGFFDRRDLVQVKYEMLRRVREEGQPISRTSSAFGFSRPAFYEAQAALDRGGIAALIPKKRGPRSSHKLNAEVMEFLQKELSTGPSPGSTELARLVGERFGRVVHPRSVERALARLEKKPMIDDAAPATGCETVALADEELRHHVLAGSTAGLPGGVARRRRCRHL